MIKLFDSYQKAMATAVVSWTATGAIVLGRAFEWVPQHIGTVAIITLGVGIASSVSISRYRLATTIGQVFQLGLQSAISLSANVFTDTCIMIVDKDGNVESADHADAIGWDESAIIGRPLESLLTPRSHEASKRHMDPGTSIVSPMRNQEGGRFDARLSFAAIAEHDEASAGRMVVTISPVVSVNPTTKN